MYEAVVKKLDELLKIQNKKYAGKIPTRNDIFYIRLKAQIDVLKELISGMK